MGTIEQIKKPILKNYEEFSDFFQASMQTDNKLLSYVLNYIIKTKGKELRPILVLLSAKLVGEITEKTYVSATLIELLHTATLVHDDVVDNSQIRRSNFSIKALWKSKLAVLVGDYLLAKGLEISVQYEAFEILKTVSYAVQEMAKGELVQLEKSRRLNITEEVYFKIIERKTASLLMAAAKAGVLSVSDDVEHLKNIEMFAKNLGLAFQIKDDLFDYEKTNTIGKPSGNDLKESKLTLPLIYTLDNVDKKTHRKIKSVLSKKIKTNADIDLVRNYVYDTGGIDYTNKFLMKYIEKSKEILNSKFADSEAKNSLNILVDYIVKRKK